MFPAVVTNRSGKAYWVIFLVDTGSPRTYLSAQTSDLFSIPAIREDTPAHIRIAGRQHRVFRAPQHSHLVDINILGSDFLDAHEISLLNSPDGQEARLFFRRESMEGSRRGRKVVDVGPL
ncbi:hypothetical protein HOY80DRAFT_956322 [Tuber brumale]|nr:hypothetical protein HOY80DRAFT_956322 [Tuber brumale]